MKLWLPAAPAGSGSVGAAAGGDGQALPSPGGASALRLVGGDACVSPAG